MDGQTDRQTDRQRRSDPLVSPLLTAGDTKTMILIFFYPSLEFVTVLIRLLLYIISGLRVDDDGTTEGVP